MRNFLLVLLLPLALHAEPRKIQPGTISPPASNKAYGGGALRSPAPFSRTAWTASLVAMGVGTGLDIASSWRQPERNPLVRSGNGEFGWRGVGINAAFAGGTIAIQYLVLRRLRPGHPAERVFSAVNFGWGGFRAGVAFRNWRMRR